MDTYFDDIIRSFIMISVQGVHSQSITRIVFAIVSFLIITRIKSIKTYVNRFLYSYSKENSIELVGSILEDSYHSRRQFSKRFVSLIHHISCNKSSVLVKKMMEICIEDVDHIKDQSNDSLIITQEAPLLISNDIVCSFKVTNDEQLNEKTKTKYTNIVSRISSSTLTTKQLKDFLDKCVDEYDTYIQEKLNKNLYYFVYENDGETSHFKKVRFTSTKTFANVFFKEKKVLMDRLDFFMNNSSMYQKFGIPHTFGILMHGEPGTGKTSTIKAIANHTNRHIISVPLHKIKDISILTKLFLDTDIDGICVPFNKRIYVFEEIDCNGLQSITKQRKMSTHDIDARVSLLYNELSNILEPSKKDLKNSAMLEEVSSVMNNNKSNDVGKLTLGGILELFDGLVETPGRIMIITTNMPEELDKALTRPGRIDMNICFTKTTREDIINMFHLWYNIKMTDEEQSKIPDYKYTHAEVCQIFFNNVDTPQKTIKQISE